MSHLSSWGYRHWASADEAQLEQFGDISYMMAYIYIYIIPTLPRRATATRLGLTRVPNPNPMYRLGLPALGERGRGAA